MAKAVDEMSHWDEYEYIIVNHDVGKALGEIQSILDAERLKRDRQTGIPEFVGKLV
jgi:guanylate kinase